MNTAKLRNPNHISNMPYPQRKAIADRAMVEPQKIKYRKAVELTPHERQELDRIEAYQNANRGFYDDENEQLENDYYND